MQTPEEMKRYNSIMLRVAVENAFSDRMRIVGYPGVEDAARGNFEESFRLFNERFGFGE